MHACVESAQYWVHGERAVELLCKSGADLSARDDEGAPAACCCPQG
jgi:hypothetical protein